MADVIERWDLLWRKPDDEEESTRNAARRRLILQLTVSDYVCLRKQSHAHAAGYRGNRCRFDLDELKRG